MKSLVSILIGDDGTRGGGPSLDEIKRNRELISIRVIDDDKTADFVCRFAYRVERAEITRLINAHIKPARDGRSLRSRGRSSATRFDREVAADRAGKAFVEDGYGADSSLLRKSRNDGTRKTAARKKEHRNREPTRRITIISEPS